jgi:hypothetical protein
LLKLHLLLQLEHTSIGISLKILGLSSILRPVFVEDVWGFMHIIYGCFGG